MKIKLTFLLGALCVVSLFGQRHYTPSNAGKAVVLPHAQMTKKSAAAIDTVTPFPASCGGTPSLFGVGGGYVSGTNGYGDLEKAEYFSFTGNGTVSEVMVFFGAKEVVGTADNISVKIYSGNPSTGPATVLGTSAAVSVSNVDTSGMPTSFTFNSPVSFSGEFFASVEVDVADDTLGILHTGLGCQSTAWEMWSDNSWNNLAGAWSQSGVPLDISLYIVAVVDVVPASCPPPSGLGATNVNATTADIYWTTGGASDWNVEYGPMGFSLGNGISMNATNDTLSLTGLTPGTAYDFYVRDSCGAGDVSTWVGPFSFMTDCAVQPLPYTETFEIGTSSTIVCISAQSNWSLAQVGGYGNSANSMTFPFYNVQTGSFSATFPEFQPTSANFELRFDFAKAAYGSEADSLKIYYSTDGGMNYSLLVGLDGSASGTLNTAGVVNSGYVPGASDWSTYSIALPAGVNRIRMDAVTAYGNNLYLDNISIASSGSSGCSGPTSLGIANESCDEAELSWTASNNSGYSLVEYGPTGFQSGTGTMSLEQSPFVITGLAEGTDYEVYVADTCGTDTTAFAGPVSFSTLQEATADFVFSVVNMTDSTAEVSFDASTSQGANSYDWNFGDGNNGTGVNPQHTYGSIGTFDVTLVVTGDCGTDTATTTIVLEDFGLRSSYLAQSLKVYPNPTSSNLTVDLEAKGDVRLRLMSISGKQVKAEIREHINGEYRGNMDLSNIPNGVYILKVKSGTASANIKVIKR